MKKSLMTLALLLSLGVGSAMAADVSIGIRIGPPPAPRVVRVVPRSPGADFVWVTGYWYPVNNHYRWHDGYWTRPPYSGARWVTPHYEGGHFYNGYWDGGRGQFAHDHHSDRHRDRDYRHDDDRAHR